MSSWLVLSLRTLAVLAIALAAAWGALCLYYRLPGGGLALATVGAAWVLLALAALVGGATGRSLWIAPWAAAFGALLLWYGSLRPSNARDWAADVARPLSAEIGPERVVVRNVRAFDWRGETDATPRWEERSYDLADLRTVDVINSYWAGPEIAHTLVSFGFGAGRQLAFSIEIRREEPESYSNLAGFFKQYELVYVAADERDIVRLRSNVRREDVRMFRLKVTPDQARRGFLELLGSANRIAAEPAFYNSLSTNCTTEMFGAARAVAPGLPLDWRIILSGYLPDYLFDQGLLDTRLDLAALRERGRISERALAADAAPDFSERVRVGLPDPNL